jgi:hypothetical protein
MPLEDEDLIKNHVSPACYVYSWVLNISKISAYFSMMEQEEAFSSRLKTQKKPAVATLDICKNWPSEFYFYVL